MERSRRRGGSDIRYRAAMSRPAPRFSPGHLSGNKPRARMGRLLVPGPRPPAPGRLGHGTVPGHGHQGRTAGRPRTCERLPPSGAGRTAHERYGVGRSLPGPARSMPAPWTRRSTITTAPPGNSGNSASPAVGVATLSSLPASWTGWPPTRKPSTGGDALRRYGAGEPRLSPPWFGFLLVRLSPTVATRHHG
jgi:hypothetical protein